MEGTVSFDLYHGYLICGPRFSRTTQEPCFPVGQWGQPHGFGSAAGAKASSGAIPCQHLGSGRQRASRDASVPSLNFGPMQRDNISLLIEDLSFLQKALPVRVDGVIGLDLLGQSAFVIDYASREIHFGPSPELPVSIPLRVTDGLAIVDAELNNVPAHLLVDTGASSLILFARSVPRPVSDLKISAVQRPPDKIGDFKRKQVSLHSLSSPWLKSKIRETDFLTL